MSTLLQLWEEDATNLFDLNAGGVILLSYKTASPELRTEDFKSVYEDGADVLYVRHDNVSEEIRIMVTAASNDAVEAIKANLEKVQDRVNTAVENFGPRYYLRHRPDGETATWRSRLHHVRISQVHEDMIDQGTSKVLLLSSNDSKFELLLIEIVRVPYWEDIVELPLPLSNVHGTKVTNGITVDNKVDATHNNYVDIDGADIAGSIPAPIILEMTAINDYEPDRISSFHIAKNGRYTPSLLNHILQAEDATYIYPGLTSQNGVVSGVLNLPSLTRVLRWEISSATLAQCRYRWFRILGSFNNLSGDSRLKLRLTFVGLTLLQETDVLTWRPTGGGSIVDLGVLRLPPYELDSGDTPYPLQLELYMQNPSEAPQVHFSLDFLQLTPTEQEDGYMLFTPEGYALPYGWILKWDGPAEKIKTMAAGYGTGNWYVRTGFPILLRPGQPTRLQSLITSNMVEGNAPNWSYTLKAAYRKRKRTI